MPTTTSKLSTKMFAFMFSIFFSVTARLANRHSLSETNWPKGVIMAIDGHLIMRFFIIYYLRLFHTILSHILDIVQTVMNIGIFLAHYKDLNISWTAASGSFSIFPLVREI